MPQDIRAILSDPQLDKLRDAWGIEQSRNNFKQKMGIFLPSMYPESLPLLQAVQTIFYGPNSPSDSERDELRSALSEKDRERIIVALLAERDINSNIGLHMYIALMLGISPAELAHILLLAGVYSGIPGFADGLQMAEKLLLFLSERLATNNADDINPDVMFEEMKARLDAD